MKLSNEHEKGLGNSKNSLKICIIVGTRPEIIKMSPIIRLCEKKKLDYFVLHTGQHYSYNLDKLFFEELELPTENINLNVGSGTNAEEVGKMLIAIEKVLLKEKPSIVLVEGDTNTVLAGALTAVKLRIKVGHVEAGLRSYDREMPEEYNRIIADHISDFLFAPTDNAKNTLLKENIPEEKIFMTGNTIVDAVQQNLAIAKKKSKILEKLKLKTKQYFLLTAHRQENVDKKERLAGLLEGLKKISYSYSLPIIYPIHPRTEKMIKQFNLEEKTKIKNLRLIKPIGFLDFLMLEANAKLILTDSGGVQEESCILKIPCVTLRENTERTETIKIGANILAGTNPEKILSSVDEMLKRKKSWKNPFGDGKAATRIVKICEENGSY